jgi:long-chain acyl-CoA synthetase
VVRRPGAALDETALTAFLEGKISRMKQPKHVEFVEKIPRNASGKVLKTALRTRH